MSSEARQNAVSYPRQRVRLPYPRSKSGCLVCRRLHKKCDERRPICTRCLLKGKACQWPRAQRDRDRVPNDDNVPSFHDTTPPVQDSVNNSHSYENDTSSPLSIFGGNSRSGDKDLRLIAPPSCSMGNVSSMFLAHFVAETSRYMTTVSPEKNPFLTHLLPLAFSNELILHALLALGGAHLERKQSSSEISTWACRHHGHVIYLLKDAISQESIGPLEWVQILLVQLVLYLIGVCLSFPVSSIFPGNPRWLWNYKWKQDFPERDSINAHVSIRVLGSDFSIPRFSVLPKMQEQ